MQFKEEISTGGLLMRWKRFHGRVDPRNRSVVSPLEQFERGVESAYQIAA